MWGTFYYVSPHIYLLGGHQEKPNVLQFHPQARSLLASAGYDCKLLLWDLSSLSVAVTLDELPEPVTSISANFCSIVDGCAFVQTGLLHGMESRWSIVGNVHKRP